MGMNFDQRVGAERSQFATQVPEIPKELLDRIAKGFTGNEPSEFYEGLLSGYACCYGIINQAPEKESKAVIGGIIAYISEILEERN